jgi:hypothetical protein
MLRLLFTYFVKCRCDGRWEAESRHAGPETIADPPDAAVAYYEISDLFALKGLTIDMGAEDLFDLSSSSLPWPSNTSCLSQELGLERNDVASEADNSFHCRWQDVLDVAICILF